MAVKSLFLSAVVAAVVVNFCTSADIPKLTPAICTISKMIGEECTQCNFLTFGQDEVAPGISLFCPNVNREEDYCCYGPSRSPFCCNQATYFLTGALWVAGIITVLAVVCQIIKCLIK